MAKVLSPNKEYTGLSAGVTFVNGQGETNNEHVLQWFEERGYTVLRPEPESELSPPAGPPPSDESPDKEQGTELPSEQPEAEPGKPARRGK